ncbi:MAG: zinc dependent phospholipase C family protein [Smithella sp.]|jgi:hypothetical protein
MPAAFAHMIAADKAKRQLEKEGLKLPQIVLNEYPQWLQAGAVGPDYPYLHHMINNIPSESWADLFHYVKSSDIVRAGVKTLKARYPSENGDENFKKALAWLYGYASHVVLDASIHPVVRAIVGEYEQHKTEHRACEMFMDSFIYKEYFGIELDNSDWVNYLKALTDANTGGMDLPVAALWHATLKEVHPSDYANNSPQIDGWQKAYEEHLSMAEHNAIFFRHAAADDGILYELSTEILPADMTKYIEKALLPKPNKFSQDTMHYRDIIEFGANNVARFWVYITNAIEGTGDPTLPGLLNWNLDKGTIDPQGVGNATLWV